jgi:hypothetical protein
MGLYNGAVITSAGQNILAQAISGTELTWTAMRASSVAIPEGTDLTTLTALTGIKQTAVITDSSVYGSNVVQVSARFSNTGISEAYLMETIGIYGQVTGGSETLIAVMTAETPDEMPVYDQDSPSAFIFNVQMSVQNANSLTMVVNDTGTATVADLNRKVDLNGGDLSDTKGKTFTPSTALYPVISAGDTFKVMCGKIAKFCADIVKPFTGATASTDGTRGLVSAPSAGYQNRYLRGDGTWRPLVFGHTTTVEGFPLDAREANPNVSGSLAADVKALNDSFSNLFLSKEYSCTYTIPANSAINITAGSLGVLNPDGYMPLFCRNLTTGNDAVLVKDMDVSNVTSDGAVLRLRNFSSLTVNATVKIRLVYCKPSYYQNV